jgi:hypothetical protein
VEREPIVPERMVRYDDYVGTIDEAKEQCPFLRGIDDDDLLEAVLVEGENNFSQLNPDDATKLHEQTRQKQAERLEQRRNQVSSQPKPEAPVQQEKIATKVQSQKLPEERRQEAVTAPAAVEAPEAEASTPVPWEVLVVDIEQIQAEARQAISAAHEESALAVPDALLNRKVEAEPQASLAVEPVQLEALRVVDVVVDPIETPQAESDYTIRAVDTQIDPVPYLGTNEIESELEPETIEVEVIVMKHHRTADEARAATDEAYTSAAEGLFEPNAYIAMDDGRELVSDLAPEDVTFVEISDGKHELLTDMESEPLAVPLVVAEVYARVWTATNLLYQQIPERGFDNQDAQQVPSAEFGLADAEQRERAETISRLYAEVIEIVHERPAQYTTEQVMQRLEAVAEQLMMMLDPPEAPVAAHEFINALSLLTPEELERLGMHNYKLTARTNGGQSTSDLGSIIETWLGSLALHRPRVLAGA